MNTPLVQFFGAVQAGPPRDCVHLIQGKGGDGSEVYFNIFRAANSFILVSTVLAGVAVTAMVLLITLGRQERHGSAIFTRPLTLLPSVLWTLLLASFLLGATTGEEECSKTWAELAVAQTLNGTGVAGFALTLCWVFTVHPGEHQYVLRASKMGFAGMVVVTTFFVATFLATVEEAVLNAPHQANPMATPQFYLLAVPSAVAGLMRLLARASPERRAARWLAPTEFAHYCAALLVLLGVIVAGAYFGYVANLSPVTVSGIHSGTKYVLAGGLGLYMAVFTLLLPYDAPPSGEKADG